MSTDYIDYLVEMRDAIYNEMNKQPQEEEEEDTNE